MHDLPFWKKLYYSLWGNFYAFTYLTNHRRFLGAQVSSWVKFITLVLPLAAWGGRWGATAVIVTAFLAIMVRLLYWQAKRAGYTQFVGDGTAVMQIQNTGSPLPAYQRVKVRATGLFSVQEREDYILLRPAEYWQVPLGEHVVMVEPFPKRYLYQFFNANTLQEVKRGWLIFGASPLPTLAITFLATWGPDFADDNTSWIQKNSNGNQPSNPKRTIYFTFENEMDEQMILHTVIQDARRARLVS